EWLRVIYRNQQRRRSEYTIPVQIVRHSWSTVTVLAFVFFGTLSGDWIVEKVRIALSHVQADWFQVIGRYFEFFSFPDRGFLEVVLGISIGAISALLGLLFALYGVGFQITTEKYSSRVADYVNQEGVGNFFFQLLVFTDLYAIIVLLRVHVIMLGAPV